MHKRYAATTIFVCAILVPLLYRHHLRDLAEVIRTYSTFKNLELDKYRYPPDQSEADFARNAPFLAPNILHQIFLQEGRNSSLDKYQPARTSCEALHTSWYHMLWTDDNATTFVADNYPAILPHYINYAQTIQRTNILRYLLLHHYGGVYLDLDVKCRTPLDDFQHLPWVTPAAHPAGINNAFILTKPQHPFLNELIAKIPSRDLTWGLPYVENMLSTGCMFITNAWMSYMRRNSEHEWEDKVFVLADEYGGLEGQMLRGKVVTPVFEHGGASSWHSWDAGLIFFVGKHAGVVLGLLGAALIGLGAMLVYWSFRRRMLRHRRRSRDFEKQQTR